MTVTDVIDDIRIKAYKPKANSAFVTVPQSDLFDLEITERAEVSADQGSISIYNDDGTYSGANRITAGDKLVVEQKLNGANVFTSALTLIARNVGDTLPGAKRDTVDIEATDFVFTLLQFRRATNAFRGKDVGNIIDTLVDNNTPEIGRGQINTLGVTTDFDIDGRTLFEAITRDLAPVAGALIAQAGEALRVKQYGNISTSHPLKPKDLKGNIQISRSDSGIQNDIRVDGGTGHDVDVSQTTQSSTETVTDTNRKTVQVTPRKSEFAEIDVYTQKNVNSSDKLRVRLQAEQAGSPVDVSSTASDIANKALATDFLAADGFTTFLMPGHTFAPNSDVFIIVEASGSTGQDVGVDGSGNVTYSARYPFPLVGEALDSTSQSEYRQRDARQRDNQLDTFTAVNDRAAALVQSEPAVTLSATADSTRAADLSPGDVVDLQDIPRADVSGRYIVRERRLNYTGTQIKTGLTLRDAATLS